MRVLVATDGSEFSKAAVAESCRLLIRPDTTEIAIVSAFEDALPFAGEPVTLSGEYYQQMDDAFRSMAEGYLTEAEATIRAYFSGKELQLTTEVLRGAPDRQIIEKAKEWKADVVVVGSHGRGFWGRLLGSVSDGVVHHAPCSVLVVRQPVSAK